MGLDICQRFICGNICERETSQRSTELSNRDVGLTSVRERVRDGWSDGQSLRLQHGSKEHSAKPIEVLELKLSPWYGAIFSAPAVLSVQRGAAGGKRGF